MVMFVIFLATYGPKYTGEDINQFRGHTFSVSNMMEMLYGKAGLS
ncbi:MAG: hypothetical protein IRD7MM_02695 [Candidatus Midichloria mitochondrii]